MLHRPEMSSTTYRSADNGATWTAVELDGGQTQNSRIVADPVNPDVFYVMDAQANLYRSDDGAKSFAKYGQRLQNDGAGEYYNGGGLIRTVPGREGHLWVPMDQAQVWLTKGFSENGLAYSENGGKDWTRCEGAKVAIAVGIGYRYMVCTVFVRSRPTAFPSGIRLSGCPSAGVLRPAACDCWVLCPVCPGGYPIQPRHCPMCQQVFSADAGTDAALGTGPS